MTSLPGPVKANITAQGEGQAFAPVISGNVFHGPVILRSDLNHRVIPNGSPPFTAVRHTSARCTSQRQRDYTDDSTNLKDSLKAEYERILDGNSLTGHRRYLNEVYTELYIVENETGGVIQGHEVRQMETFSSRSAGADVPVRCNDIFKVRAGGLRRNRKVLTMGIAGVGKTVSVNKFILDWAEGKENKDIVFVFPLPFRELNLRKDENLSLMELLQKCLPGSTEFDSLPLGDGKVLFIFDGLDECRFHLNFKDSHKLKDVNKRASVSLIITNLIKRNLLPNALVWITSRPAAAHLIPRDHIDQVTEVRGFNDKQKEEYISRYCGTDLASTILAHIKKSRSLYIMCHIPVFCWISATALQTLSQDRNPKTPTTLTGMYVRFLVQQANQMKNKYHGSPQEIILKLAELAFCQLEKGNLIFYKEDLEVCGIDVNGGSVYSGLCTQIFKMEKRSSERMVFSFVHLSVQEALAAIHVLYIHRSYKRNVFIQNLKAECKWWFRHSSYKLHKAAIQSALQSENGHLDLFLRFLLGLSVESNKSSLEELLPGLWTACKSVGKTIDYIKTKIRLSESSERTYNLFHCLSELEDDSIISEVQSFLKSGDLSMKDLSSTQWSALVFVLLMSDETQEVFELKKYRESDDGLRRLLPVVRNTKNALLDSCHITEASCGSLASVLRSNSTYLVKLDLSNNDLQDSGVELLSEGLKSSHCKLKILKLSGCMVTKEGCSFLALALSSNPSHLRELDLSYNHPGQSGKRELYERLEEPHFKLQILNFDHSGEKRIKPGLGKYACELTLDPDTAHANLSVSDEDRTVKWSKENPPSPDHPARFDTWSQVLCRESLSGRCYWEVQWSEMGVHIGVTYKGICRKGAGKECWLGQNHQSWSLDCTKMNYTARHNGVKTVISAAGRCSYKIGVYLDWAAGRLSFYDVSSNTRKQKLTHLYTFTATFTEPLYTGFLVIDSTVTLCKVV
ncbi:NLR family CARD domain-containing protein 3-like [Salminus brasiliensis]|uniref:NLR family CARD domain-containing protein 3-like n=1 Tax=Salminus brasiliensis TaxID=930266 RepID=UPI003B836AD3